LRLRGVPLDEALDHLRETTRVNIVVHWARLEAAGLSRKAPVDLDLHDVAFTQALHHLLASVAPPNAGLAWAVEDRIVVIGRAEDLYGIENANAIRMLKIYDVGDLIRDEIAWRAAAGAPPLQLHSNPPFHSAASPGGGPEFSDEPWESQMEGVIGLITDFVAPDTWLDNGGMVGSIHELNGRLVIRQTWENHLQIGALFDAIQARGVAAVAATRPIRPDERAKP
jgi:hypothetical protein